MNKSNLYKLSILSFCILSACSTNLSANNVQIKSSSETSQKMATVTLNINPVSFKKSSNDGQAARFQSEIKSYRAFLTTNKSNPLAGKVVPSSDLFIDVNKIQSDSGSTVISFPNVPVTINDLPYYAVVAAFDKTTDDISKVNITEEDNVNITATGVDKKWAISRDNVRVNANLSLSFSGQFNQLNVNIQLKNQIPVKIDTNITTVNGQDISRIFDAI